MKKSIIRHSVAVGDINMGGLGLGSFSQGRRANIPQVVSWGGNEFLVGDYADQYGKVQAGYSMSLLVDGPNSRALAYASIANLLENQTTATIEKIVVGLPVEVLADARAKTYRRKLNWLKGTHVFIVDGREYVIEIKNVASVPQPAGAYFNWALDFAGQWQRPLDDVDATITIADIGFNTFDLFTVRGKKVEKVSTGGAHGMKTALDMIQSALKIKYDVEFSPQQIDRIIRGNGTIHIAEGKIDVSDLVTNALASLANASVSFMISKIGNGRQIPYLRFVGGGVMRLKDQLLAVYPLATLSQDAVFENALGLAKYARRNSTGLVIGLDPGFGWYKAVLI